MGIDRSTGVEQVEDNTPADRRPPPPPDRPGQEPEGVPSRLEARRATAATENQAAESTDPPEPTSDLDTEPTDTADAALEGTELASSSQEAPGVRGEELGDDAVGAEEDGRPALGAPDASAGGESPERTDQPYEVESPQIVRDYYTNIPPTAQDRYLVRDQSNPVPVFDGPPTRDQVVQGRVGDCGIVATLGAVAEHRSDAITDAIEQVGDDEYEISLHEITEATPADPVARPTGAVRTYRVNDELPVRTDNPLRPPAGIQAESCGWPTLMEKVIAAEDQTWDTSQKADWDQAWTTRHKPAVDQDRANAGLGPSPNDSPMGYNRLDVGSTPYQRADLLAKLTGEDAEVRRIPGEQEGEQALLDDFRDRLDTGKPVLVGTRGLHVADEQFPEGIYPGHAYEVTKIENDRIHIHNPWGYEHPDPMDAKTFWEYYRHSNPDGTRDGHYTTLR